MNGEAGNQLGRCRIVLVRPQFPGNLGATARVMRNLGLSDLVLVAPVADKEDRQAQQMAAHGEEVLRQARTVADLSAALADCVLVAGTSARSGGTFRRQPLGTPDTIMPHLLTSLAHGPVALVFGPESSGLSNDEVTRCHYLIHIPTDDAYPALNLAQAVAICGYELRRQWLAQSTPPKGEHPPASFAELEHMLGQLQSSLEQLHFLYGPNGAALMHALRHLLSRAQPTAVEVGILRGLARQIRWYVENHPTQSTGKTEPEA